MTDFGSLFFGGDGTLIIIVLTGLTTALTLGGVFWIFTAANEKRQVDRRLATITSRAVGGGMGGADTVASIRRSNSDSSVVILDRLIKQVLPNRRQLQMRLVRTGYKISIGDYLVASLISGIVFSLIAGLGVGLSPFLVLCVFLLMGVGFPHFVLGYLGGRRRKKFVEQFPEAIDMIIRGIKSGLPVTEAMGVVGSEMIKPMGTEFSMIADNLRFGKTLDEALLEIGERIKRPEFDFFVVALSVQRETGGNLAETLENLSDVLRKRGQMKKKVKALAAEPKTSAMILGSLPFIMFAIIFVLNSGYIMTLFEDPRGMFILGIGLLSEAVGVAIMVKMVNFEI